MTELAQSMQARCPACGYTDWVALNSRYQCQWCHGWCLWMPDLLLMVAVPSGLDRTGSEDARLPPAGGPEPEDWAEGNRRFCAWLHRREGQG